MPKRPAFSYHRLSTGEQQKGYGKDRQTDKTAVFCERYCLDILEPLFEVASGWKGENLKGKLGKFLATAQAKKLPKATVLVVEGFSRMFRLPFRPAREF